MKDEETLKKQARDSDISPYELRKRELNYRPAEGSRTCPRCRFMVVPHYRNGKEGMQCEVIGVMEDRDAWVGNNTTCNFWKQRP